MPVITFNDDFTTEGGTNRDKFGFVNGLFQVNLSFLPGNPPDLSTVQVECWWFDRLASPTYPVECFARSTGNMSTCRSFSTNLNTWCTTGGADCSGSDNIYPTAIGGWHNEFITSSQKREEADVEFFYNCGSGTTQQRGAASVEYYIINKKRNQCLNDTSIKFEGNADGWRQYSAGSCPLATRCNSSLAGIEITTQNGVIPSPCQSWCPGRVNIAVEDSQSLPISGVKTLVNGVQNGTTDSNGMRTFVFSGVPCTQQQTFTMRCSDDTFCDQKTTSINYPNQARSLFFNCNICRSRPDHWLR